MSVEAVKWALEQKNLTLAEKMTLVVIAEAAKDHKGTNIYTSWLSAQTIADRGSMGRRTVFRSITKLVEAKKITLTGRSNMTSIYTLMGNIGSNRFPTTSATQALTSATQAQVGATQSLGGARVTPLGVPESHPNHNKPLINPTSPEQNLVRPAYTRHQSPEPRDQNTEAHNEYIRSLGWDPLTMQPITKTEVN